MRLCVTGHRPDKLGGYEVTSRRALGCFAVESLHRAGPELVITGMALGWDQAIAGACVMLDIPFIAAVPFKGQERPWPHDAKVRYDLLLERAREVVHVCDVLTPTARAMQIRNEWMVDRADSVLALWNGTFGGTHNCIAYAKKQGVPVTNLWNAWDPKLAQLLG